MRDTVIVVTRGDSLLIESLEAGLRARGVRVYKRHPCWNMQRHEAAAEEDSVTVFDLDELSANEVFSLKESMAHKPCTLLALNRKQAVALRYRVDQVVLTGLRDVLAGASTSTGQAVSA